MSRSCMLYYQVDMRHLGFRAIGRSNQHITPS